MSAKENKAIVSRINEEVWNHGNLEVIDELIPDAFVTTVEGMPEPIRGPRAFREFVTTYRNAFPDLHITTEEQIAERDVVATRWTGTGTHQGDLMGISATGKQATVAGININHFSGGKLTRGWGMFDQLGLLQQLGAIPAASAV